MVEVRLAYYRKTDWKKHNKLADDRADLHDSWNDWHKSYQDAKKTFTDMGLQVIKVVVDLDELMEYCRLNGLKNIGDTRSKFVNSKR